MEGGSSAHLVPVTLLLLVEVIPDIVLHGVAVSVRHQRPRPAAPDSARRSTTTEAAPAPTARTAGPPVCAQCALVGLSTKEPFCNFVTLRVSLRFFAHRVLKCCVICDE